MRPHTQIASWWSWPSARLAWTRPRLAEMLAWAGTAALLLVAPFERVDARLVLPGQTITNVEAVLVAALGAWTVAAAVAGRGVTWRTPLTTPALLLAAALALAALVAPAHQANALKFTGRFVAGFAVCLLTVNAAITTERMLGLMRVAVASGAIVGVVAILEFLQIPAVLQWLARFRETAHVVGGAPRMSSTLQYPTIASMYLEVVFAFALALLVRAIDCRRLRAATLLTAALVIVAEAIILTLTRAGLVTMALALGVVLAGLVVRRGFDRAGRAVLGVAGLVAACLVVTWSVQPMWVRFTSEGQEGWYRARYEAPAELRVRSDDWQRVPVTVHNDGRVTWRSDEGAPFRLSYHWLTEAGDRVVQFDGLRSEFPAAVGPGESVTLSAWVRAPSRPGRYRLAWDVVQEHRLWFSTEGSPSAITRVEVWGAPVAGASAPPPMMATPTANVRLGRLALWRLAIAMIAARPLLGVGPDNFRLLYGAQAKLERADPRVHTNNMYLELFVGAGLVGGALFLWLLWRAVASLAGTARAAEGARFVVWLGLASAVAVTLVHGLVDSFLTFTPTYLLIWITLGLAVSSAHRPGGVTHANRA